MKILLINGSPREGNTARVLEALAARLGGHDVETLRLGELGIRGCIGCLRCQQDVEHFVCHQTGDDANAVLAKIVAADVVLMATPLYGHCFTAQMKCLDAAQDRHQGEEHPPRRRRSQHRLQDRRLRRDAAQVRVRQEALTQDVVLRGSIWTRKAPLLSVSTEEGGAFFV